MAYIFTAFLSGICLLLAASHIFIAPAVAQNLSRVIFAGLEFEPDSAFMHTGGKLSLDFGENRVFLLTSAGLSLSDLQRTRRGRMANEEINAKSQLFLGWERSFDTVFISGGLGPSLNRYVDRNNTIRLRKGIAALVDVWYRPDKQRSFHLAAIADSGAESLWIRLRYGWQTSLLEGHIGPEVAASRNTTSRVWRIGLHFSEWKLGPVSGAVSGGFNNTNGKSGAYASFAAYMTY